MIILRELGSKHMLFEDLVSTVKKQRKIKFKDFGRSEHFFLGGGIKGTRTPFPQGGGFGMTIMSRRNGSD